jgi:hypothetical protein
MRRGEGGRGDRRKQAWVGQKATNGVGQAIVNK